MGLLGIGNLLFQSAAYSYGAQAISGVPLPIVGNVGMFILYSVAVLFIVAVVMMVFGLTIPWAWFDPRPRRWRVLNRGYTFWKETRQFTNLFVPAEQSVPDFNEANYSLCVDVVIYNTRNYRTTEGPYRHILHRGSNELAATSVSSYVASGCAAVGDGSLPPFGLPKRMNPGIFIDPNVNDILVFVDSSDGVEMYRESVRIQDLPLDIPFRIEIIVMGRILEVYLNCKLEVTKTLSGNPRLVENAWYGVAGPANMNGQIQNLVVWNELLQVDDMKTLCPGPPKFANRRPNCDADAPMDAKKETKPNTIDLGFSAKLNTC